MFIASHPELENHPKTLHLQQLLNLDIDQVIGKLHRLWWWATKYAEDGDLSKYGLARVNHVIGLKGDETALIETGFLDTRPFLKIHDWWEYAHRYFRLKYRNQPGKLIQIERKCFAKKQTRIRHAKAELKPRLSGVPVVHSLPAFPALPAKAEETAIFNRGGEKKTAGHDKTCTCEHCWAKNMRGVAR